MKALAVFPKKKEIRLVDHPEPRVGAPTEIKIKILNVGVCGTDREIWKGEYGTPPHGSEYLITGHESLGQVVETGAAVQSIRVGDHIVLTVRRGCPENCVSCAAGEPDFCYTGNFTERGIKKAHGYMTEFVVEDEKYANVVPASLASSAVLLEPLTITEKALIETYKIQSRLHWPRGSGAALVLGAGPVGFLAAMALRLRNFRVAIVARHAAPNAKSELCKRLGVPYFGTDKIDAAQISKELGGVDFVLEATGAAQASFDFLQALGTNGIFVFTGVPAPLKDITIDAGTLMRNLVLKNQVVLGTVNAPKQAFQNGVKDLQAFGEKWPKELAALITDRVPIENYKDVVEEKKPENIKTIFTFSK
jgi:glucose 1-dehydrogenase